MPVGTLGTVKGLTAAQLKETGAQMVLANTYHLHMQPGEGVVVGAGGGELAEVVVHPVIGAGYQSLNGKQFVLILFQQSLGNLGLASNLPMEMQSLIINHCRVTILTQTFSREIT